jgi:hypothetical protein
MDRVLDLVYPKVAGSIPARGIHLLDLVLSQHFGCNQELDLGKTALLRNTPIGKSTDF